MSTPHSIRQAKYRDSRPDYVERQRKLQKARRETFEYLARLHPDEFMRIYRKRCEAHKITTPAEIRI